MLLSQTAPAPPLIDAPDALTDFIGELATVERAAVDTEADSLHCYFEKLCLVQVSIAGRDVLIDPLAGVPLDSLFSEFSKKKLVLHGADFDIRMLRRAGQIDFGEIFDTQIAARLTGSSQFSLAALIAEHFGVQLAKHSQKANWAQRPLSEKMAEYAANDTRFLLTLADKLEERL